MLWLGGWYPLLLLPATLFEPPVQVLEPADAPSLFFFLPKFVGEGVMLGVEGGWGSPSTGQRGEKHRHDVEAVGQK